MWHFLASLPWQAVLATVLIFGFYFLILAKSAAKKEPKPGEDFDERGPYNDAVETVQKNVSFDFKKFLGRK